MPRAKRSDAAKLGQWPITIKLCGGEEFKIPQPKAGTMLAWADGYFELQGLLIEASKLAELKGEDSIEVIREKAKALPMAAQAAKLKIDLFFDFCGEAVDRKRVLAETEMEEFSVAVIEVHALALPLATRSLQS